METGLLPLKCQVMMETTKSKSALDSSSLGVKRYRCLLDSITDSVSTLGVRYRLVDLCSLHTLMEALNNIFNKQVSNPISEGPHQKERTHHKTKHEFSGSELTKTSLEISSRRVDEGLVGNSTGRRKNLRGISSRLTFNILIISMVVSSSFQLAAEVKDLPAATTSSDNILSTCPSGLAVYHYMPSLSQSLFGACSEFVVVGQNPYKVFNREGTLLGAASGPSVCYSIVMMDGMKLFLGGDQKTFWEIASNPSSTSDDLVLTLYRNVTTGPLSAFASSQPGNSNFIVVTTPGKIWKSQWVDGSETAPVNIPSTARMVSIILTQSSANYLLMQQSATKILVVSALDFSITSHNNLPPGYSTEHASLDNLAPTFLFATSHGPSGLGVLKLHSTSLTNPYPLIGFASLSQYTYEKTQILNLGTMNYLLTVHKKSSDSKSYILVIDKSTCSLDNSLYLSSQDILTWAGLEAETSVYLKYYFGTMESSSNRFESHYFLVDNCISRDVSGVCTLCPSERYKSNLNPGNLCLAYEDIAEKSGIDIGSQSLKLCSDSHCTSCKDNYLVCKKCDFSAGYYLAAGICEQISKVMYLKSTPLSQTSTNTGLVLTYSLDVIDDITDYELGLLKFGSMDLAFIVEVNKTSSGEVSQDFKLSSQINWVNSRQMILKVSIVKFEKMSSFITLVQTPTVKWQALGNSYEIFVTNATTRFNPSSAQRANLTMRSFNGVIPVSRSDSLLYYLSIFVMLTADPTGTFFRFTKILQIVNRLYFININQGDRLEGFLANSASFEIYEPTPDHPQQVYNSRHYRGKLSDSQQTLDFVGYSSTRIIIYITSWIISSALYFLRKTRLMGRVVTYAYHYMGKVHTAILNTLYIDMVWLAHRTIYHSMHISTYAYLVSIGVLMLICVDMTIILYHVLSDDVWYHAYYHYTSINEFEGVYDVQKRSSRSRFNKNRFANQAKLNNPIRNFKIIPKTTPERDSLNENNEEIQKEMANKNTSVIDKDRTNKELDFKEYVMDIVAFQLRVDKQVFGSTLCRLLSAAPWYRALFIRTLIFSCQYANHFALTTLVLFESVRLLGVIYAQLKFKYLKNRLFVMMEFIPSFTLLLFFQASLFMSGRRRDEEVSRVYQAVGMWIIVSSCVVEYGLLVAFIVYSIHQYLHTRKIMKRNGSQRRRYQLIKYKENPLNNNQKREEEKEDKKEYPPTSHVIGRRDNIDNKLVGQSIRPSYHTPRASVFFQGGTLNTLKPNWNNLPLSKIKTPRASGVKLNHGTSLRSSNLQQESRRSILPVRNPENTNNKRVSNHNVTNITSSPFFFGSSYNPYEGIQRGAGKAL